MNCRIYKQIYSFRYIFHHTSACEYEAPGPATISLVYQTSEYFYRDPSCTVSRASLVATDLYKIC